MSMVDVGEDALLRGQFEKACWALDAALYLDNPDPSCNPAPSLWQRGLSCYYSGLYQEGERQFECDMSENGSDIEEVIWHFLCRSAAHGFEKSLSDGFLPLCTSTEQPVLPPMQQVLDLYKGTGSVEAVLDSATAPDGSPLPSYNDTNALAYAHFYISLYYEVCREFAKAKDHFRAAAEYKNPDYMGRLMGMHSELFCHRYPLTELSPLQSKLIQGGWQLSQGHLINSGQNQSDLVRSLLRAVDAGIRSFDCGDIYTGVEELYGRLLKAHCLRGGRRDDIAIHTKLVPDLEVIRSRAMDRGYVESVIRRSLNRLGVERLDLVQFHWWDISVPGSLDVLCTLGDLVREGLVGRIGLTNFDTATTRTFVDAGIKIASTQVQYSLLDRRPLESGLVELCAEHDIDILAYGVLAGGFLTDAWLGRDKPEREDLPNRSLVKYLLIIEEFGGWELFQRLLHTLRGVADRHTPLTAPGGAVLDVSVAMVAMSYVLRQRQVKGIIVGTHSDKYLHSTVAAVSLELTAVDVADMESVLCSSEGPGGHVYGLEREWEGPHASIMKYNLNQVNKGQHLEELCHRYLHLHFEGHPVEATRTGYRHPLPHFQQLEVPKDAKPSEFDFNKTTLSAARACGYDHLLGPHSESDIQDYCVKVALLLEEAEGVDRHSLSPDQLVDLRLITSQLKLELLQWRTVQSYKKDPAFYLPLNSILYLLPTWGPEMQTDSPSSSVPDHPGVAGMSIPERLLALLSRLRAIPSTLIQAHRNLTKPLELFVRTALDICDPFSSFLANDLAMLCDTLADRERGKDLATIVAEIKSATTIAAKSVKKYESFLRNHLLPRSSASLGVGKEVYDEILKHSHFINSSEEILALGEEHFAKVKRELEALASEIDPTKTWQEITTDVIHPMHPTASNLLQAYMTEIERCRSHMISHDLVLDLPRDERVVGFSTPKFLIPFSPVGDYLNPSPFARMSGRENIPRVGHLMLHSITARGLSESEEVKLLRGHDHTWISVVSPHESYPGHHVQALRAQDHPRILRKYHESFLFYEGWGLYTEQLAYETGFFSRDLVYQAEGSCESKLVPASLSEKLTRLTQLRLQLWRAARIILDVKLNTGQLTFEACREFLHSEVMFNQGASQGEVFMYASRPTYATCYVTGFVMIMRLREEARKRKERKGEPFELREFHDDLLSKGCIPFELLTTLL